MYSSDTLAEGYFGADEYSDRLKEMISRYQYLKEKEELTEGERAERAALRYELKNIPKGLSQEAADLFHEIEGDIYDKDDSENNRKVNQSRGISKKGKGKKWFL